MSASATDTLIREWGNPKHSSFKQKNIRIVKAGGIKVQVHRDLVDVVQAMLAAAAEEAGGVLPELDSWIPMEGDGEPMSPHFGIALTSTKELSAFFEASGFELNRELGVIEFTGTAVDARDLGVKAETGRMLDSLPSETGGVWYAGGPGSREIGVGDMGDDVMCFQLTVDCPTQTGYFDTATEDRARTLNGRYGITHDVEKVNADTWKMLTRLRHGLMSRGDVGAHVRMLQATLVAYDWRHDLRITGHFDRPTDAAVRQLQGTLGLRESGMVRLPEWCALLQRRES